MSQKTHPLLFDIPSFAAKEFERLVIYPVTSLRVAVKGYDHVCKGIYEKGTQKSKLEQDMQSRKESYETIQYYDYEKLDGKIAKIVL